MKNMWTLLSFFSLLACDSSLEKSGSSSDETKRQNVALVERYIEAVKSKDTVVMGDLLSEDYWGYGPSVSDSLNKEQALANWSYVVENLYDSIQFSRKFIIAEEVTDGLHPGNYVSSWVDMHITFKDGSGPVHLQTNAIYRIENDKITLSRTFYNEADVYRQLGLGFCE